MPAPLLQEETPTQCLTILGRYRPCSLRLPRGVVKSLARCLTIELVASFVNCSVVFQKWRWPFLHRPSKGVSIDKQANDNVVHLRRFREADGLAHQSLDARP